MSTEAKRAGMARKGDNQAAFMSQDDMESRISQAWLRIGVAAVFAGQGMVFSLAVNITPPEFGTPVYWILHGGLILSALVVMGFLGGPLFRSTVEMARARRLSIEGLFTLSLVGAFIGSLVSTFTGSGSVYYEVVAIVIAIYTLGRLISERSQSRLALESERLRERFDRAVALDENGAATDMPLSEVTQGTQVAVGPGEPFTVDGIVSSGVGYVRETALTGEPMPVVRRRGDAVRAGTWSVDGTFQVEARAVEGERELDRILETVEDASGRPSEMQTQADALIQGFLPLVAGVSLATGIYWSFTGTWGEAVFNSMAVLLVACPCAMGLATPVAVWQGLFRLARMGLVSRDGALIDVLARTKQVFFDKTGTLSEATMRVTELFVPEEWLYARGRLLGAIRATEEGLAHPVARALCAEVAEKEATETCWLENRKLAPGQGVEARVRFSDQECWPILIGDAELVGRQEDELRREAQARGLRETDGKAVYVFVGQKLAAVGVVRERFREGVDSVWEGLEQLGVRVAVLTGDREPELTLPSGVALESGLSAEAKVTRVEAAKNQCKRPLFVGDGINDAGAMASASGSIAMSSGSGLTRSAAGGQLTADRIDILPEAIRFARDVHRRLRGNLRFAAAYNVIGMSLAAAGALHPVVAALIMLVSSFFVTSRALQCGESNVNG